MERRASRADIVKLDGPKVRQARTQQASLTQEELAPRVGISRGRIGQIERGPHAGLSRPAAEALASALGTDLTELLSLDQSPRRSRNFSQLISSRFDELQTRLARIETQLELLTQSLDENTPSASYSNQPPAAPFRARERW